MSRLLVLLCTLAVTLTGALPADVGAAHLRKGRATCVKVVKRDANGKKRRVCRKKKAPAKKAPAKKGPARKAPAKGPKRAPRPPAAAQGLMPVPPAPVGLPAAAPAAPAASVPAVGTGTPAATTPVPAAPVPAAPLCGTTTGLGIRAEDADGFRFVLSRTCLPAGPIRVQLTNRDSQPHEVSVAGLDPVSAPRRVVADVDGIGNGGPTSGEGTVDLGPGRYRFFCAILGHEAMAGTVTVSG